jgi:uncharacterized protein
MYMQIAPQARRPSFLVDEIRRRPMVAYFALAYTLTWSYEIAILVWWRDGESGGLWTAPASFGPMIAALVIAGLTHGKEGVRHWLAPLAHWRVGWGWHLVVLVGIPALAFAGTMLVEGKLPSEAPSAGQFVFAYGWSLIIEGALSGPLGEEPGWRGFALPRLEKRFGPLLGSLVLVPLWTGWHLPLFFTQWMTGRGTAGFQSIGLYFLVVASLTIIFTWVFNKTGGSVLIAILLHASINTGMRSAMNLFSAATHPFLLSLISFGGLAMALVVATGGQLGYEPAGPHPPRWTRREPVVNRSTLRPPRQVDFPP